MFERPASLHDRQVSDALREHWSVDVRSVEYAALGFGSHHWYADDHFVTVDYTHDRDALTKALTTSFALCHDAELAFVVAPIPSTDGSLLEQLGDQWVMHVYDRLDVIDDTAHGAHDDPEVIDLVRQLHAATPVVEHHARREDWSLGERADLEGALETLDAPWESGPYGDRCRTALSEHVDALHAALARHDGWVATIAHDDWVVTHGEPHRGNVFRTASGWAMVDWDTVLVAPPERDWWDVTNAPGEPSTKDLYRFRWALLEVACYVSEFLADHTDDRNTQESWQNFLHYLAEAVTER